MSDIISAPPPELLVLAALKETCEQVRRHNSSVEVAKAALAEESRIEARMQRLQSAPEARAA